MEVMIHSTTALFDQLGLDSTLEVIEDLIQNNWPLPSEVTLCDAECWNASQAAYLRRMIEEDADWAEVVDQLDASKHPNDVFKQGDRRDQHEN